MIKRESLTRNAKQNADGGREKTPDFIIAELKAIGEGEMGASDQVRFEMLAGEGLKSAQTLIGTMLELAKLGVRGPLERQMMARVVSANMDHIVEASGASQTHFVACLTALLTVFGILTDAESGIDEDTSLREMLHLDDFFKANKDLVLHFLGHTPEPGLATSLGGMLLLTNIFKEDDLVEPIAQAVYTALTTVYVNGGKREHLEQAARMGFLYAVVHEKSSQFFTNVFGRVMRRFGVRGTFTFNPLVQNQGLAFFRSIIRMGELEMKEAGICRVLNRSPFFIRAFHTYPTDVLLDMYRTRHEQKPYMLVLSAVADHNASLSEAGAQETLRETYFKLKKMGIAVRCIESTTIGEIGTSLQKLDQLYGEQNKIGPVWARGHSHRQLFALGHAEDDDSFVLPKHVDLYGKNVSGYFTQTSTLIIDGCLAGKRGGLAEKMTKIFKTVIAFPHETSVVSIDARKLPNGELKMSALYYTDKDGESEHVPGVEYRRS